MKLMLRVVALFVSFLLITPTVANAAHACSCVPIPSSWQVNGTPLPVPLLVCPQGDTATFLRQGWWISLTCNDTSGLPSPGLLPQDFWLVAPNGVDVVLCGGASSSNADSATNAAGMTTLSNTTMVAGGCSDGLMLVALGVIVDEPDCSAPHVEPIYVRSPDLDGSLVVDLVDLSIFAAHFPPGPYEACCDFDINGVINIQDLANFGAHFGPVRHRCI